MNFPKPPGRPGDYSPAGRRRPTGHFWKSIEEAGDRAASVLAERRADLDRAAPRDARLIGSLVLLNEQLPSIIDELTSGEFHASERAALATVLGTIIGGLEPQRVLPPEKPRPFRTTGP